jgi:hypothetical protein
MIDFTLLFFAYRTIINIEKKKIEKERAKFAKRKEIEEKNKEVEEIYNDWKDR